MKPTFLKSLYARTAETLAALAVSAAIMAGTAAHAEVYEADPKDEIKFETKRWARNFINIENGPIAVTTIKDEAWSSRWYLEPVGFEDFVRIQNRWTGCYLNVEEGPMNCGTKDSGNEAGGRWSAQWRIIHQGGGDYMVVNRWTECHLSTGYLKNTRCSKENKTAGEDTEYIWRLTNLTNLNPAPTAPPVRSRANKIAALGGCAVKLLTTDGGYPDTICASAEGSNTSLGGSWNDDIEVVYIADSHVRFIGYENANFTGNKVTLDCGDNELIGDPENEITSYKIIFSETPFTNVCKGVGTGKGLFSPRHAVRRWDP